MVQLKKIASSFFDLFLSYTATFFCSMFLDLSVKLHDFILEFRGFSHFWQVFAAVKEPTSHSFSHPDLHNPKTSLPSILCITHLKLILITSFLIKRFHLTSTLSPPENRVENLCHNPLKSNTFSTYHLLYPPPLLPIPPLFLSFLRQISTFLTTILLMMMCRGE